MCLYFENISFSYKNDFSINKPIFSDFSLHIKNDEKIGLFGKIGTGKTTLVKILVGEEKMQKGKIILQNSDINKLKNPFEKISILFQKPEKQFVFPNIKDEIDFIASENNEKVNSKIKELAEKFDFNLKLYLNKNIYSLSAGELRLLQIILVLSNNKPFLIFDDPFLFLDENEIGIFKKVISSHNNKSMLFLARNNRNFTDIISKAITLY